MFVVGVFNCTLCVCISFFSLSVLLSRCAALMRNNVYICTVCRRILFPRFPGRHRVWRSSRKTDTPFQCQLR